MLMKEFFDEPNTNMPRTCIFSMHRHTCKQNIHTHKIMKYHMFSSNVEKEDKANRGMALLLLRIPMFKNLECVLLSELAGEEFSRLLTVSEGLLYGHAMKVLLLEIL